MAGLELSSNDDRILSFFIKKGREKGKEKDKMKKDKKKRDGGKEVGWREGREKRKKERVISAMLLSD